ncbi:SGNH/GDSL hydrolase family protein [Candidatus Microgenomates bacterium]|nr:MAG: SGNH/GDSL hydrolase family protein [Candidatus Microgenomates bacterium]
MPYIFLIISFISGFMTVRVLVTPTLQPIPQPAHAKLQLTKSAGNAIALNTHEVVRRERVGFKEIMDKGIVLGVTTASPTPEPSAESKELRIGGAALTKKAYTIGFLGDSMIDTLGPDMPEVKTALRRNFPGVTFTLINHGVGGANLEQVAAHLTNNYSYLNESRTAALDQNPDIIVIESAAYNHWDNTKSDLDRQWLTLAKMVDTIKARNPAIKIVIAATISPYCPTYTDGSADLPVERKFVECEAVKAYLQNAIHFANSQNLPLVDAYHASLLGDGQENGNPKYINEGDHIHPSEAGKRLFGEKLAAILSL